MRRQKDISFLCIGIINVKLNILPKVIYGFLATPNKNLHLFLYRNVKTYPKMNMEPQKTLDRQSNSEKKTTMLLIIVYQISRYITELM